MQTLKTTFVVGTLLIVGYGVHVVLINPPHGDDPIWNDASEFVPPDIDLGVESGTAAPASANPPATAANALASTPPAGPAENAAVIPPPFATPGNGGYPTTGTEEIPSTPSFAKATPAQSLSVTTPPVSGVATNALPAGSPATPLPVSAAPTPAESANPLSSTPTDTGLVAPTSHTSLPFDEMWASAQQKLDSGDLVNALLSLSLLYCDDSLYDVQRDRLITLLDKLAGTVIYSPQHLVSPQYIVAPGDTWESVAKQLQVPAAFLSRVNGVPMDTPLQAGQQLKVVSGPFRAELSLSRRELTLFLGRYYAGRFNVGIGRDLPAQVTELEVCELSGPRPYVDARTGQSSAPGAPDNPYGQFWIGLRSVSGPQDPAIGIHDTGSAVDASDTRGCITVSSRDADDLQAILSLGSRIVLIR